MNETSIRKEIQVALSGKNCRMFRNNVGEFHDEGKKIHIVYGLCPGSSDLIGWKTVTITPEMCGREIAIFFACEVKKPDGKKPTPAQENFIAAVQSAGGIAFVAHSPEEAENKIANI